jgi:hypothetical protein
MNQSVLYKLELHQVVVLSKTDTTMVSVIRVPGGWIYRTRITHKNLITLSEVFVPFNNEYQEQVPPGP